MLGVRFLDVDFTRINFACGFADCLAYTLFLHSRKEKNGCMERIAIAMQDGGTGAGAQHGVASREANLILSCRRTSICPPVGGTFWFQIFIQAPSPEIWSETISGGEEVLAGKWDGLFLGYLLRKKFIGSRGEAPPFLLALATRYDAQHRGRARSKRSGVRPV